MSRVIAADLCPSAACTALTLHPLAINAEAQVEQGLDDGPLAPFADDYRRALTERGYTAHTREHRLRQMARLSAWLEAGGLSVAELRRHVEEFLAFQRSIGRHRTELSRPGLLCLLDVLEELGKLERAEPSVISPTETDDES